MVAVEELLLYFLIVPAVSYGLAAAWMRRTQRKIAERELGFLREPGVLPKSMVFLVIPVTPILFGMILYVMLLRASADPLADSVVRWLGTAFAVAAILTALSEAWIVVRRRATS